VAPSALEHDPDHVTAAAAAPAAAVLRRPVAPAVLGGALWIPYGTLELVQPWGADTRYDEARGYDVVVDRGLHHLSSLPGSLALLLCAVGLLVLLRRLGVRSRAAGRAGRVAAALAAVSAGGVLLGFDPAFTGARILGTVVLGVGLLTAGRAAGRTCGATAWRPALLALGGLALLLLPLWPLVFAVQWLSAWCRCGGPRPARARVGGPRLGGYRPARLGDAT
jgi:hypothetical protein